MTHVFHYILLFEYIKFYKRIFLQLQWMLTKYRIIFNESIMTAININYTEIRLKLKLNIYIISITTKDSGIFLLQFN